MNVTLDLTSASVGSLCPSFCLSVQAPLASHSASSIPFVFPPLAADPDFAVYRCSASRLQPISHQLCLFAHTSALQLRPWCTLKPSSSLSASTILASFLPFATAAHPNFSPSPIGPAPCPCLCPSAWSPPPLSSIEGRTIHGVQSVFPTTSNQSFK